MSIMGNNKIIVRYNPSIPKELLDRAEKAVKKYIKDNLVNNDNKRRT